MISSASTPTAGEASRHTGGHHHGLVLLAANPADAGPLAGQGDGLHLPAPLRGCDRPGIWSGGAPAVGCGPPRWRPGRTEPRRRAFPSRAGGSVAEGSRWICRKSSSLT